MRINTRSDSGEHDIACLETLHNNPQRGVLLMLFCCFVLFFGVGISLQRHEVLTRGTVKYPKIPRTEAVITLFPFTPV